MMEALSKGIQALARERWCWIYHHEASHEGKPPLALVQEEQGKTLTDKANESRLIKVRELLNKLRILLGQG